jgi:phage tail-like protein
MNPALMRSQAQFGLVPLRLPSADPGLVTDANAWMEEEENPLLLVPGESSAMRLRLANPTDRSLRLSLVVQGNFPSHWCIDLEEIQDVPAGRLLEPILTFQIPADFLEPLQPPVQPLPLDYRGQLQIYQVNESENESSNSELLDAIAFRLIIRPTSRYLPLLPQVFREIDLVGRFLQVIEQAFDPAVQTFNSLWAHLDPATAPEAMLPFLAHWMGWHLQPYLSLDQQRRLIRNALEIYRWRGTRRGLRLYLHLATGLALNEDLPGESDKQIGITESFHQGFVLNQAAIGEHTILGGGRPFHFSVHLRPEADQTIDEALVQTVIEQEKPAFSTYELFITPRPTYA